MNARTNARTSKGMKPELSAVSTKTAALRELYGELYQAQSAEEVHRIVKGALDLLGVEYSDDYLKIQEDFLKANEFRGNLIMFQAQVKLVWLRW